MTTNQLDALLAVAHYGSINKAAESLYITQPALKKRLDSLENELGLVLLQRDSSGCRLTEAGQAICDEISPLYNQMKACVARIQDKSRPQRIRISQVPFLTLRYCDKLMSDFHRSYSNISIERVFMTNDHWFDALRNGEIDVCLAPGNESAYTAWRREGFCCIPDGSGQLITIVPSDHPLADRPSVTLSELIPYPVYAEPIMLQNGGLAEAAANCGLYPETSPLVYNRYDMADASGSGKIFLHDSGLGEDIHPLIPIPVTGFSYTRYIILRNNKEPALRSFQSFLTSRGKQRPAV